MRTSLIHIFFGLIFLQTSVSVGAVEDSVSTSLEDIEEPSAPFQFVSSFSAASYENKTTGVMASSYAIGLGLVSPGKYLTMLEAPFLTGYKRGVPYQEAGNPKVSLDFKVAEISLLDLWMELSARFSRPDAELAHRHDTYRAGSSIRLASGRVHTVIGGGYRARVNEQDRKVDVGDVTDARLQIGFSFLRRWSAELEYSWLRSNGVKKEGMVIARPVEWAGIAPGIRYRLGPSLALTTSVIFPVLLSRGAEEAEVALWDAGTAGLLQPAWVTQLGVTF